MNELLEQEMNYRAADAIEKTALNGRIAKLEWQVYVLSMSGICAVVAAVFSFIIMAVRG